MPRALILLLALPLAVAHAQAPKAAPPDVDEPGARAAREQALAAAIAAVKAAAAARPPRAPSRDALVLIARTSDVADDVLAACRMLLSLEPGPAGREWLARASLVAGSASLGRDPPGAPAEVGPRQRAGREALVAALQAMRGLAPGEPGPAEALALASGESASTGGAVPGSDIARRHLALARIIASHALNRLRRRSEAEATFAAIPAEELGAVTYWPQALLHVARGDAELAVEVLRRLIAGRAEAGARDALRTMLRQDPLLAPLRARPDWPSLVADGAGTAAPFAGAPPRDASPASGRGDGDEGRPLTTVGGGGSSMRFEVPPGYVAERLPDGRVALVRSSARAGPATIVVGQSPMRAASDAEARRWLEQTFPGARVRHAGGARWALVEVQGGGRAWVTADARNLYFAFLDGGAQAASAEHERVVDRAAFDPVGPVTHARCAWCSRDLRDRRDAVVLQDAHVEAAFCDDPHRAAWLEQRRRRTVDHAALQAVLERIPDFGRLIAERRAREGAAGATASATPDERPAGLPSLLPPEPPPPSPSPRVATAPRARLDPAAVRDAQAEAEAQDEGALLLVLGALAVTFICGALLGSTLRPRR